MAKLQAQLAEIDHRSTSRQRPSGSCRQCAGRRADDTGAGSRAGHTGGSAAARSVVSRSLGSADPALVGRCRLDRAHGSPSGTGGLTPAPVEQLGF